jgi:hypothetical protein
VPPTASAGRQLASVEPQSGLLHQSRSPKPAALASGARSQGDLPPAYDARPDSDRFSVYAPADAQTIATLQAYLDGLEQSAPAGCDQGPTNLPRSQVDDLDQESADWGVYCEGAPTWVLQNAAAPSLDGTSLRCSMMGGAAYSNVHCYRNLPPEPDADGFILSLSFWLGQATTCNNQGTPSIVQALEFSMSKWQQSKRYEFAVQWQNVGDGAPQWRYWDPHRPEPDRWAPLSPPAQQCLQGGQWHTLTLEGRVVTGQVQYRRFTIDGQAYTLDVTIPPVDTPGQADRLAVAVQLDGNAAASAYDLFIDRVNFTRSHFDRLYLPQVNRVRT